jgi:hypothetical protein
MLFRIMLYGAQSFRIVSIGALAFLAEPRGTKRRGTAKRTRNSSTEKQGGPLPASFPDSPKSAFKKRQFTASIETRR